MNITDEELQKGSYESPASSPFVIMSKVRGHYYGAEDGEGAPNEKGYPACPKGGYERPSAAGHVINTYKMCKFVYMTTLTPEANMYLVKSIHLRGHGMRILHLHSVSTLNVSMLKMCLDSLPHLEVLGVYNCELLHFGVTREFLQTIVNHNNQEDKKVVRSDFSPYYYHGPQCLSVGRKGEFGVVASDHGTVETRRAVTAILSTVVPLALDNGIDWFTPGTGMRQFLERIPFALGSLRYILEALYNLWDFEHGVHHQSNDQLWSQGSEAMRRTLYNDLVVAVNGRAMHREQLDNMMSSKGGLHLTRCSSCDVDLPAFFYTNESMSRVAGQKECSGCQLRFQLDNQIDSFHQEKKEAVKILLEHDSTDNIDTFINGKRFVTDKEIKDPTFPFWFLSVKTPQEVLDSCNEQQESLVVDGRPDSTHPVEYRSIWIWKERVLLAMEHASREIDRGMHKAAAIITQCQDQIKDLDIKYERGLFGASRYRENRDMVDKLERYIDQERARCGAGQLEGRYGTRAAMNWDEEVEKHRQMVQAGVGAMANYGPYNTVSSNLRTGFF